MGGGRTDSLEGTRLVDGADLLDAVDRRDARIIGFLMIGAATVCFDTRIADVFDDAPVPRHYV